MMESKNQSECCFYRIKQLAEMLSVSKSSIWGWVKNGTFPKPIKFTKNVTVWSSLDIAKWIENASSN